MWTASGDPFRMLHKILAECMFCHMANSLDLDPEWGSLDLIEEVEAAFGIKMEDAHLKDLWTVGDLYDVICKLSPQWDDHDGSCASSVTFYRIRKSLGPVDRALFTPRSRLSLNGISPNQFFKMLEADSGLRLPSVPSTNIGLFGFLLCLVGILGSFAALFEREWTIAAIAVLVAAAGIGFLRADPGKIPDGIETVGDLVKRTVPLNVQTLATSGARPPDRWSLLVGLSAEHGLLRPDEIGPDTFLLRKGMEMASA